MAFGSRKPGTLGDAISDVVSRGNCSGCGACALLDPAISMGLSDQGYLRPQVDSRVGSPDDLALFERICPGRRVVAQRPESSDGAVHPVFGRAEGVWEAWASDDVVRNEGSSGGVLTALAILLMDEQPGKGAIAVAAAPRNPSRSVPVRILSRDEALRTAGSRYAPASVLASLGEGPAPAALTLKPCEASALRQLADESGSEPPVLLSFFCAGTPTQSATDRLVAQLGLHPANLTELRYRGKGWPGSFVASDGQNTVSENYEQAWNQYFGRALQDRCKICVDGTGEAADVAVGDYWQADDHGYPVFDDADGRSVLIARTLRGRALVERAIAIGVIQARALDLDLVTAVQPHQRVRRRTLLGRLLGRRLLGGTVPSYQGFSLVRGVFRDPLRTLKAFVGSLTRGVPEEVAKVELDSADA